MNSKKFEDSLKNLQALSKKINSEEITLDESIKCYEDGMKCYKDCMKILDDAKQKIEYYEG